MNPSNNSLPDHEWLLLKSQLYYLPVNERSIVGTGFSGDKVLMMDKEGKVKWSSSEKKSKGHLGIAIASEGFVLLQEELPTTFG